MSKEIRAVIGFLKPNSKDFPGESRVFLPSDISLLTQAFHAHPLIWSGHQMPNHSQKEYLQIPNIQIESSDEPIISTSDMIISLKHPSELLINLMKPGQVLVTMAHFHTRPGRIEKYIKKGIRVISMDSIIDEKGNRIVQDLKGVAWNGIRALFDYAEQYTDKCKLLKRDCLNILILGSGGVGIHAVNAARYLGDKERKNRLGRSIPIIVTSVGSDVTSNPFLLNSLLKSTDVLVDATNRIDPTTAIIENHHLVALPPHAAIVDLASDYYDPFSGLNRTMVKAIEGIPTGDGSQYIFSPDDLHNEDSIPKDVPHDNRRLTLSHGSWPALDPEGSMQTYGRQLIPLLIAMAGLNRDPLAAYDLLSKDSPDPRIRTLFTGTLTSFLKAKENE